MSANVGQMQKDKEFVKKIMGEELDAIDTGTFHQMEVQADVHGHQNIPEVLMEKYEHTINEIDEEMIERMMQ